LCFTKYQATKTNAVLNQAPRHEEIWGSGGIAPRILNLGTIWRWVVSFTPRLLYPRGKRPQYPLDRRLGGTQSPAGRDGEDKKSLHIAGIEPRTSSTDQFKNQYA
jgi:hypothetical protein